jgi:hypothetical protein
LLLGVPQVTALDLSLQHADSTTELSTNRKCVELPFVMGPSWSSPFFLIPGQHLRRLAGVKGGACAIAFSDAVGALDAGETA